MSLVQGRGGIFISYRREDADAHAGRLYDRLCDHFGEDRVFMDVDSIAFGVDFTRAVIEAVSGCDILLALIGRDWLTITDGKGRRRIDNPDDWVRTEIETALQRDIRVVPVLVDGAELPQADDLPPSLRSLIRRQALKLSHASFRSEAARLVTAIDKVLEVGTGRSAAASKTASRGSGSQQRKWKLELLDKSETGVGTINTFRLSSGAQVHVIIVKLSWREVIEIDGKKCINKNSLKGVHYLNALSSILGSDVTIKVINFRNELKSLALQIGDQVLTYQSETK